MDLWNDFASFGSRTFRHLYVVIHGTLSCHHHFTFSRTRYTSMKPSERCVQHASHGILVFERCPSFTLPKVFHVQRLPKQSDVNGIIRYNNGWNTWNTSSLCCRHLHAIFFMITIVGYEKWVWCVNLRNSMNPNFCCVLLGTFLDKSWETSCKSEKYFLPDPNFGNLWMKCHDRCTSLLPFATLFASTDCCSICNDRCLYGLLHWQWQESQRFLPFSSLPQSWSKWRNQHVHLNFDKIPETCSKMPLTFS